jgi:hypothetical protein
MTSTVVALTWEIWQRGRSLALAAVGIAGLCATINSTALGRAYVFKNFEPFYWLLMVCSIFLVFGVFHHAEFDHRKSWHGFPYRLFALPVPTWMLVSCPMVLGVISVELTCGAWARLVFAPVGRHVAVWPAVVLGVGLMCYQAIVWGLAGFRITRIIALSLTGMVLMNFGSLPVFLPLMNWPARKAWPIASSALCIAAVSAFFGAWFFVERQRRGGGRGRGWLKAQIGRIMDATPRRKREFGSPAAAQFWYEWRRTGVWLPICVIITLVIVFLPVSWLTRHDDGSTLWIFGWALALPLILAAVLAKGFGTPDFGSGNLSVPTFLAVRPFSSEDFVATKLKVAALSVGLAWLAVLAFLVLWLGLWANVEQLNELWDSGVALYGVVSLRATLFLSVVAVALLTWVFMVDSLWVALLGSKRWLVVYGIVSVAIFGAGIWGAVFWVKHFDWKYIEQYVKWLGWALVSAVILKSWLAVFSWRKVSPKRVLHYAIIWSGGTACFVALALLTCPNLFWLKHLVILASLLVLPLARLGLAPLSLSKNRHR